VTDGWASADTGGAWSGTNSDFDVASGVGTIALGSNTNRNAYLTGTSLRDQELLVRVKVDRLAVGSDHFVWVSLRRQDSNNYYQARLTFSTSGSTVLSLREVDAGTTTVLDAATTSVPHATSDWYWLRVRLTGSTTLEATARLWKDGSTEPSDWTVEATDASPPSALQNAGQRDPSLELTRFRGHLEHTGRRALAEESTCRTASHRTARPSGPKRSSWRPRPATPSTASPVISGSRTRACADTSPRHASTAESARA
jgi:hypothetical protein